MRDKDEVDEILKTATELAGKISPILLEATSSPPTALVALALTAAFIISTQRRAGSSVEDALISFSKTVRSCCPDAATEH